MGGASHGITYETHAPTLRSWVASAEALETDFPIQNLPYGRFRRLNHAEPWRIGVAIGDQVLDLAGAASEGRWEADIATLLAPLAAGDLAALMARPSSDRRRLRTALSRALRVDGGQQQRLQSPFAVGRRYAPVLSRHMVEQIVREPLSRGRQRPVPAREHKEFAPDNGADQAPAL